MRGRIPKNRVQDFLSKAFIEQKLNNTMGIVVALFIAMGFGYLIATKALIGFGLLGLAIGLAAVILCLLNTEAGLYLNIAYSFFAFGLNRFMFNDSLPVGVGSDILVVATFLSLFVSAKQKFEMPKSPVMIWLVIMYVFLTLELFNPYAHSFQGWLVTFRKVIAEFMLLLIAYNLFNNRAVVKRFIRVLFVLCVVAGAYGCLQQVKGLFDFEMAWVTADPNRFGLIYISGTFRKFATMSDPTAFGIIMSAAAVFFIVLASGEKRVGRKYMLLFGSLLMVLGMSFSGTRTAYVTFIGGLVLFVLMSIQKKTTMIFGALGLVAFLVLMYGPYSNMTINRFRTTFLGSKDESYKVRIENKNLIRPYILSHPIGGGLRTTGAGGLQYNPGHRLAGFPPDSGYMKMALEGGWIGLAILCILYFVVLRAGVKTYFRLRNPQLRTITVASVSFCFSLYVAQYPQDAIGQITDIVVYYPMIALILRAKYLEENTAQEIEEGRN